MDFLPHRSFEANISILAELDFLDSIKLVNYVRSQVKAGNKTPDVCSKAQFEDDAYLKPVLEDDALLYSLDDIAEEQAEDKAPGNDSDRRVVELQEELERLQTQFSEYRIAVQQSLEDQLTKEDEKLQPEAPAKKSTDKTEEVDADYFSSYSYNSSYSMAPQYAYRFANHRTHYSNPRVYVEGYHSYRCIP